MIYCNEHKIEIKGDIQSTITDIAFLEAQIKYEPKIYKNKKLEDKYRGRKDDLL